MARENAAAKARGYLAEGRLVVTEVDGETVQATCRGDGLVHRIEHTRRRGWRCTCPASTACSHLIATRLVTVIERKP
jgi:uncharacterized Zn finger protein